MVPNCGIPNTIGVTNTGDVGNRQKKYKTISNSHSEIMPGKHQFFKSAFSTSQLLLAIAFAAAFLFYQIQMHASLSSKIDAVRTNYSQLRATAQVPIIIRMLNNFGIVPDKQAQSSRSLVDQQLYYDSVNAGSNTIAKRQYVGGLVLPNVLVVGAPKGKCQK